MILPIILLSLQTFSQAQSLCKWPCLVLHGQNNNLVATPSAFPCEICKPICTGTCFCFTSSYRGVGERDIYPYDRSAPMRGQHSVSSHIRAFEPSFPGSSLGHLDAFSTLNYWSSILKRKENCPHFTSCPLSAVISLSCRSWPSFWRRVVPIHVLLFGH